MAVNIEIRQYGIKKEISVPMIAALKKLSYGYMDNDYCLVRDKAGKYSVLYDKKYIGRGFEIWIENNNVFLRLPLPTSDKEIRLFYSLVEKICEYFETETIFYDEEEETIRNKKQFIKSNTETSQGVLKHFENEMRIGNKDCNIIFGAYNPIVLGLKEFDEIGGTLKGFGDLLNRLQQKNVYYATPKYYQRKDGSVFGVYFIDEDCESVLPLKPESYFQKIENLTGYYVRIPDGNNIPFDDFLKHVPKVEDYDPNHIVCSLNAETIIYLANNCNVNFVTNEKVKGKYYGKEFDNGKNHLHKIKSLKLPLEELAAYNHLAVFLRWMAEHDFIHEQLLEQIPDLKEMACAGTVDLRNVIATHPAFDGGLKSYHFKESIVPFIRKFYVFNREGYPSCVDNYALAILGKEKYNCKEYKNEAYMFVPYDEAYYEGLSKYIDEAFEKEK